MQYFKFFSYYLNTRRLADLSGITIPTAAQDGLVRNSGARREAMEAAKAIAQRLLHSGSIPSLATLISQRELKGERILASLWTVFTFRGISNALSPDEAGKKVPNASFSGKMSFGGDDYRFAGEMRNEHLYSISTLDVLKGKKRMLVVGSFEFQDDNSVTVSPYIIGELTGEGIFPTSLSNSTRNYPSEIDQFEKVREVKLPSKQEVQMVSLMSEESVKNAFAEILGEHYVPKDWGGEKSDLTTTILTIGGKPTPTAFIFKGPSVKGEMHPANMGKRGDQFVRAFDEPVELVVIQHCSKIANSVVRIAESLAYDARHPRRYCTLDGADTAHILKAYGKLKVQGCSSFK